MMPTKTEPASCLRILIVEDEALIAEEIRDRLTRLGFKPVGPVDSAADALRVAEQARPDLVLMDIRLKGKMDGIEAAGFIRQHMEIPVVYITAHSDRATLQRSRDTAPFAYVLKPFQERDLMVAIEMAIHRHSLEQRLKESEQRYATTLESIGDGVISTDIEGRVTFMNPVAEALTGWKFAEAEGLPVEEVFPVVEEAGWTLIENPLRQALDQRSVVSFADPFLLIGRDGLVIPVDDCAAPIIDAKGRVTGAVVAFRDIRNRRLAEDALRKAEEHLRQSQKMEAIGRLAGGVAHDFNNLLTVINGYSEILLRKSSLDDATRTIIEQINGAGERAASLTRQLLAFGRKQVLELKILDLNALVEGLEEMLRRLLGEDLDLAVTYGQGLGHVEADPGQIEQVIMNLAINARDAMPEGGKLLIETGNVDLDETIKKTRPEIEPGRYAQLAVSDTGSGMDEATMDHLFEPFFTTKEIGKGTGLGLATVYGIVKQSGGFIYVYSEPGHGTTFKIYLPVVGETCLSGKPFYSLGQALHGNETILLVEDEDAVRSMLSSTLRSYGYTVLEAGRGPEAVHICEQHPGPIHLLVTDIVMPEMSGRQVAERLVALRPEIQVLYMSGYTDDTLVRQGVLGAEVAFLQKPFAPDVLAQKVREVMDRTPCKDEG